MLSDLFLTRYMQTYMRRSMRFQPLPASWVPPKAATETPLLLYLHVPFCEELCTFCSFNRVKFNTPVAVAYFDALRTEIRMYAGLGYNFDSVYVGGGTPTIAPRELQTTLELVKELWPIKKISTETNPTHLTPSILGMLRDLGVDRLSVGVQSFNDDVLRDIGRYERYGSGSQIQDNLVSARGYFETLNVDMLFNYPMQNEQMLLQDLKTVRRIQADQITFYPLMSAKTTTENNGRRQRKRGRTFYELIRRELAGAYHPSSAWCFSRGGSRPDRKRALIDEYIVEYDDYAGLGAGSFGYLQGSLYSNTFDIPRYIDQLKTGMLPLAARKEFSRPEQIRYYFLMKLFGGSLELRNIRPDYRGIAVLGLWKEIVFFLLAGAVEIKDRKVTLTGKGYYLWLVLMREFFTGVNIFREASRPGANVAPPLPAIES